jgi:hypothetical protein
VSAAGQLGLMIGAFALGTAAALALGAITFGVAMGIGQICFAAATAWAILRY